MAPKHTVAEAYQLFFQNLFNFNGRTRRSDFWRVVIINSLVIGAFEGVIGAIVGTESAAYSVISYILSLAVFVLELALMIRRLHDTGKEWTYILWELLPLVGWIIVFVALVKDSDPMDNQYGPSPKAVAGEYQAPAQPYAAPAQTYIPPQPAEPAQPYAAPAQPYAAPAQPAEAPVAQPYVAPAPAPEPAPAPVAEPVEEPIQNTAAYCTSCGSPLPLGSNNCPNCGASVK